MARAASRRRRSRRATRARSLARTRFCDARRAKAWTLAFAFAWAWAWACALALALALACTRRGERGGRSASRAGYTHGVRARSRNRRDFSRYRACTALSTEDS